MVEKALISYPEFHLPNRTKLLSDTDEATFFMVDASECEIERLKKDRKSIIQVKKDIL